MTPSDDPPGPEPLAERLDDRPEPVGEIENLRRRLEISERRNTLMLENTVDAIITIDTQGRIQAFNASAEKMFGYDFAEVVGRNVSMLMPEPYAASHDDYLNNYLRTGNKRIIGIGREVLGRKKDGTVFPIDLAVGEINDPVEGRYFIGTIRDLTKIKETEAQLRQAQKMEAVGQLTGGVAHDFNNILTVIMGNLDLLEGSVADQPALARLVSAAFRATRRGSDLTRRLLAFARNQPLNPVPCDLNEVAREFPRLASRLLGEEITFDTRLTAEKVSVRIDVMQLESSLLNLAINARDAMPLGGELTITVEHVNIGDGAVDVDETIPSGTHARIKMRDTGTGIPSNIINRVVEPFFTTKAAGAGTGLGLSMVYGFVKQSGGFLTIDSHVGEGTTVGIILPLAQGTERETASAGVRRDLAHPLPAGLETVLVIEDDAAVRETTVLMLEALGLKVATARNADEALRSFETVDLVLSDIVLGEGSTGPDLVAQMRRRRPELRVLFYSGYAESALSARGMQLGDARLLSKPFTVQELAAALHGIDFRDDGSPGQPH